MKNIHIILTDKPSRLVKVIDHRIEEFRFNSDFYQKIKFTETNQEYLPQNIYITNDEEIENCWFINLTNNEIGYIKNNIGIQKNAKKIILTTDQELIKDGVQAIDDEFLEWFVKNPSCESVEVEHFGTCCGNQSITQCINCKKYNPVYKIIIPQEEPNIVRLPIYYEPKQETLEEVAENYKIKTIKSGRSHRIEYTKQIKIDFMAGAKWQAERMYTEEEVLDLLCARNIEFNLYEDRDKVEEWFEGKQYCYVKWVSQMAERETALVVWAKKKVSRSTGSVGCAENQRKDKIRTVEFSEFFL